MLTVRIFFSIVTICTGNSTKCELANIANFTCVQNDDCVQEVLDGNADLAVAVADEMARNSKSRGLLCSRRVDRKVPEQVVCF